MKILVSSSQVHGNIAGLWFTLILEYWLHLEVISCNL